LQWPVNSNTSSVASNIINATATNTGLNLFMPPATQVSNGQAIMISNVGANTFTVVKNDGTTIASIASGVTQYIYIVDNSTIAGLWASFVLGAGTSAANAAALAGLGLVALTSTLNVNTVVATVNVSKTFTSSDRGAMYNWTGGVGTLTLPSAGSLGAGWYVIVKNNGTGILTILASGANTIDGNTSAQLQLAESFVVVCSGTNFYSYAYGRSSSFFYTQLSKTITGGTLTLTTAEAQNTIQQYNGTLTSNGIVILPSTVQLYSIRNATSGAFSLTFQTTSVGAAYAVLPQNQTSIVVCDGTNVYNTAGSGGGSTNTVSLIDGTVGAPSLSFISAPSTGLYLQSANALGFALSGNLAMLLKTTGLQVPYGIASGVF